MECIVTKPVLSVIIPTRDRRIFVRKAIEYFERMDPKVEAELIIVDSGEWPLSKEDTNGHKYIRGIVSSTIGPQLNLGISTAQGEFVLRQDDDDWYSPDWYSAALQTVESAPSGIAGITDYYAYNFLTNNACKWMCWGQKPESSHWSGGSTIFRKTIWDKVKFNDLIIGSDREFLLGAYKLNPIPRTLVPNGMNKYIMIRHSNNLTGLGFIKQTNPEELAAVQKIMGEDIKFYEDLSEILSMDDRFLILHNLNQRLFVDSKLIHGRIPVGHPGARL
jgi:glycosyltransferase involved in cell wall biosynthesis